MIEPTVDIALTGAQVLTLDGDFHHHDPGLVYISGDRILYAGNEAGKPRNCRISRTIDLTGRIITPPFFNCHNHAGMAIFRGLGNDMSLDGWLNHFIWPAERKFINPETVYTGSLVSMMEMVLSGTSIFADMYFHQEEVARAAEEIGMRVILGEGLLDFPTPSFVDPYAALEHTRHLHSQFHGHPLIRVAVAAHAPYTCSPAVIREAARLAAELKIPANIHVAETRSETEIVKARYGKSPVRYLADLGFLGPSTVAHHAIYLDEEDIRLIRETGTTIATIPNSNMKLGSGTCRVTDLQKEGIRISVGTDGPASNNHQSMLRELQQLARIEKVVHFDPTVTHPRQLLRMATLNGAAAYGMQDELGSLEAGKKADLIIINTGAPHWYPKYDPYNTIACAMHSEDVESVMIGGKFIMHQRRFEQIDADRLIAEVKKIGAEIRSKA